MAQLLDFNQVVISALFASIGNHKNIEVEESTLRMMVLNIIRAVNRKYWHTYGPVVICADGRHTWRRKVFPYYKAARKIARQSSELDWDSLFVMFNNIRNDIDQYFPYNVIHNDAIEADDTIGTICHAYGQPVISPDTERFVIYSTDKDYTQLLHYANVQQFDPIRGRWLTHDDPHQFLLEHIVKGDRGDGIPNILSPDDALVSDVQQKKITAKRLQLYTADDRFKHMDALTTERYHRNQQLIDLSCVPESHKQTILDAYNRPPKSRDKIIKYFMQHRMKQFISEAQFF